MADLGSSLLTPDKDDSQEAFLKMFSAGTVSTSASDSILAPSLESTAEKKSPEAKEVDSQIKEKKKTLVKNAIP